MNNKAQMNQEEKVAAAGLMNGTHFFMALVALLAYSIFFVEAKFEITRDDWNSYILSTIGAFIGLASLPILPALFLSWVYWVFTRKPLRTVFTIVFWFGFLFATLMVGSEFLGITGNKVSST